MKGKITFELKNEQLVNIVQDGKVVGRMFSPAGSGGNCVNAVQVCGFSEAYDLWGCGVLEATKDIQLLFDNVEMAGKDTNLDLLKCLRCYRDPCQCETPDEPLPFKVKRRKEIEDRINFSKKDWAPEEVLKEDEVRK